MSKSCKDCPSFLRESEVASHFKRPIGAPVCAALGTVLGRPGFSVEQENAVAKATAKACPEFGKPRPSAPPETPRFQVSVGDPAVISAGTPSEAEKARVTTCMACANFIPPSVVTDRFGWQAGMCAAKGLLVPSNRQAIEARNCTWRREGVNRTDTSGIVLMPHYEDAFGIVDPSKALIGSRDAVVDPQHYPTDKPLEGWESSVGIRAWRKVCDPTDEDRFTHLPIFDVNFFDEEEQTKIPRTGDDEHPEWYLDHNGALYKCAVLWQELDETPALWGVAGTGKTEFFRYVAWLMSLPFDRISINENSEIDDLAGKWTAVAHESGGTSTEFVFGRIVKRWQKPGVLLFDEPNTGPDAVWQFIRPLTDNSKQLVLDQHRGEKIARDGNCYFGMAMNPAWDIKNVGARPISDADGNRLAHLSFTLPPEAVERSILEKRCEDDGYTIPEKTLTTIMQIAKDVRIASDNGTIPISWGIRPQIKVARATKWFDLLTCYRMAVTDSLEPEQANFVLEIAKGYVTA